MQAQHEYLTCPLDPLPLILHIIILLCLVDHLAHFGVVLCASQPIGHVVKCVLGRVLLSHIHPPHLYATYHSIDKLATLYFKILFFSDVRGRKQLEEVENGSLGLAEERSHCWWRWMSNVEVDERVVMCNEAAM
jgi:hypothetical protein